LQSTLSALSQLQQVAVRVVNERRIPQVGVEVRVHRADPLSVSTDVSLVATQRTDKDGFAYFDGLWPWFYAVYGYREIDDFQTDFAFLTIQPEETYRVELVGSKPPHIYHLGVTLAYIPAGFVEWLIKQLEDLIEAVYPVDILEVWIENNTCHIRYKL